MRRSLHRGGFTLIELLVTMGLMALLATVSIAGYYGAVRGMAESGARQDVISFIRMVRQRADVDNVPTAIFFENRMLREENEDLGETKRVVGIAIAVRRAGRITYFNGNYLSDEFGDLEKTYPVYSSKSSSGSKKNVGMWLYRMQDVNATGLDKCRTLVHDYVKQINLKTEEMFGSGLSGGNSTHTFPDNATFSANDLKLWAFEKNNGSGSGNAPWHVGDAYGFEIASMQLPHGYVFGSSVPSQVGMSTDGGDPLFFIPRPTSGEAQIKGHLPDIRSYRPSKEGVTLKSIGSIKSNELDDD